MIRRPLILLTSLCSALALTACPGPAPRPASKPATALKGTAKPKPATAKKIDPWAKAKLIEAPKPIPAQALKLPPVKRFTLRNGLSGLALPDDQLPLVSVRLTLPVGSIDDPADRAGLADFTAMMLRQGAAGMSAERISRRVDAAGARLSVSPGYEITTITCRSQAKDLDLCLEMVSALVSRPTFPKKEMAQVTRRLEGEVRSDRDDPSMLVAKHFYNLLYSDDHPAGRPLTLGSIAAVKRKDLRRFFSTYYRPRGAVLAISGAVDVETLEKRVARRFRRWRKGKRPPRKAVTVKSPGPGLKVLLIDKPDLTQSFFMIGHAGVNLRHADRDALRLVDYVLGGGGFSSRLMKVVRSKGGKTYGISSAFYAHEADGLFRVRSSTRNAELWRTLELARGELQRVRREPPTAAELVAAKGKLAGGYAIRFKTGDQLAAALSLAQVRGLGDSYVSELPLRIQRLQVSTVAAAAQKHVKPGALVLAVVGKGSVVAPLLDKAKVRYERIDYLAPISARARRRAKETIVISPAEAKAGKALLAKALRAAGGRKALAKVRRLELTGTLTRQTPHGKMVSRYAALYAPPERLELTFILAGAAARGMPQMTMKQALTAKGGYMEVNGKRRPLPPRQQAALRRALWRHPAFVLQNAQAKGVRLRPSKDPAVDTKRFHGLEIVPPSGQPLTLLLDKKSYRLVGLRDRGPSGKVRQSELSDHEKDKKLGIWLPRRQRTRGGALELVFSSVVLETRP